MRSYVSHIATAAVALALCAPRALAADLTLVSDRNGELAAFAYGDAGFHRLRLDVGFVQEVRAGARLAWVASPGEDLLVAATRRGVETRRIDLELGQVRDFYLGGRLALAQGLSGWVAYGVSRDGISVQNLETYAVVQEIRGDLALLRVGTESVLIAATDSGLRALPFGGHPQRVELSDHQALSYWNTGAVYLHTPAPDGIHSYDLTRLGWPRQIWMGGETMSGPSQQPETGEAPAS